MREKGTRMMGSCKIYVNLKRWKLCIVLQKRPHGDNVDRCKTGQIYAVVWGFKGLMKLNL